MIQLVDHPILQYQVLRKKESQIEKAFILNKAKRKSFHGQFIKNSSDTQ